MTEQLSSDARADYEASILARLDQAVRVPFREVSLNNWRPGHNDCHNNVDTCVAANPSCKAVRGWMIESTCSLTAHSVVRDTDGQLFDITPFTDDRLRLGFIEHEGDDAAFERMKAAGVQIFGPTIDSEELARYLETALGPRADAEVTRDEVETLE